VSITSRLAAAMHDVIICSFLQFCCSRFVVLLRHATPPGRHKLWLVTPTVDSNQDMQHMSGSSGSWKVVFVRNLKHGCLRGGTSSKSPNLETSTIMILATTTLCHAITIYVCTIAALVAATAPTAGCQAIIRQDATSIANTSTPTTSSSRGTSIRANINESLHHPATTNTCSSAIATPTTPTSIARIKIQTSVSPIACVAGRSSPR
jgi:hypothetical protein